MRSAEGRAQFVKMFSQKFVTGNSAEQLQNVVACVQALMRHTFGDENGNSVAALKANVESRLAKQDEALKGFYQVAEAFGLKPTGELPGGPKAKFEFSKAEEKRAAQNKYMQALEEIKKPATI